MELLRHPYTKRNNGVVRCLCPILESHILDRHKMDCTGDSNSRNGIAILFTALQKNLIYFKLCEKQFMFIYKIDFRPRQI